MLKNAVSADVEDFKESIPGLEARVNRGEEEYFLAIRAVASARDAFVSKRTELSKDAHPSDEEISTLKELELKQEQARVALGKLVVLLSDPDYQKNQRAVQEFINNIPATYPKVSSLLKEKAVGLMNQRDYDDVDAAKTDLNIILEQK